MHPSKLRKLDSVLLNEDVDGRPIDLRDVFRAAENVTAPFLLEILVRPLFNGYESPQRAEHWLVERSNIHKCGDKILELWALRKI